MFRMCMALGNHLLSVYLAVKSTAVRFYRIRSGFSKNRTHVLRLIAHLMFHKLFLYILMKTVRTLNVWTDAHFFIKPAEGMDSH